MYASRFTIFDCAFSRLADDANGVCTVSSTHCVLHHTVCLKIEIRRFFSQTKFPNLRFRIKFSNRKQKTPRYDAF